MHFLEEHHILIFLVQIFIILLFARGLGSLFQKAGQPPLTAELLVGVLLGPTLLGRVAPGLHAMIFPQELIQQSMLETVSWIGVLFLLLQTGLEIDFSVAWRQRGNALKISLADIIIPMIVAFIPSYFLPAHYLADPQQRLVFALFMAAVMTISALPVTARVLHDLNILKSSMGFLIMSALTVNDIIGWVLFSIVLGLFMQAGLTFSGIFLVFVFTIGFAMLALTLGRVLSTKALTGLQKRKFPEPGTSLTFAVLLGVCFGAITQKIGIHALFGFFIAGVVVGESRAVSEETRGIISQMVYAIFVPLFFANIGLKMDFASNFDFLLVLFMCVIGVAGRFLGAWFGVTLCRIPLVNRTLISLGHIPGGMMEVVIALIAMETGLITPKVFVAIVFSAIISSVILGPLMKIALKLRTAVSLKEFTASGATLPILIGEDRNAVLHELLSLLLPGDATGRRTKVFANLVLREEEFGTAVGEGVAIPHIHLAGMKHPLIAFGRSVEGVEWNAPDGEPVHYVFLLLVPEGLEDIHVQVLAQIGRMMSRKEIREELDEARKPEKLQEILFRHFTAASLQKKT